MTSFGSVFKVMSRDRFRLINKIILAELAVIVAALLWSAVTGGVKAGEFLGITAGWSMPAGVAAFVLLSSANEHVYTRDTYRLIPVGETKLYATNLLSSFLMYLYFTVIQGIMIVLTATIDEKFLKSMFKALTYHGPNYSNGEALKVMFGALVVGLTLVILGWTTISLVHLVVSATNNFLPNVSRRAVNIVLYVIVIYLVIRVAAFLFNEFGNLGSFMSVSDQSQFILSIVAMLVLALLEAALNIFLLKKWVETIPN